MGIGFELFSSDGKLQASSAMMNYHVRATGQKLTQSRVGGNTTPSTLLIQKTGYTNRALCAVYGVNGERAGLLGVSYINGVGYWNFATNGAVGAPFNYYIYDQAASIPASNFGLEVRNTANEITFSAAHRPMSALTIITPNGVIDEDSPPYVYYPGKTLAFFNLAWAGHRISDNIQYYMSGQHVPEGDEWDQRSWRNNGAIYGGRCQDGGQTCVAAIIYWDLVTNQPTSDPIPDDFVTNLKLFVVDVTGIPVGVTFF